MQPFGDLYGTGAPTGIAYYENGALPEKYQGMLMSCESARNTVFGYYPELSKSTFKLERFDFLTANKNKQFGGTDGIRKLKTSEIKTWFRPSDIMIGPDGAIYLTDWFDPRTGGHQTLDKKGLGTVYRIAPKGFKSTVPKFDIKTIKGMITALKSPAVNVRHLGFRVG